MEFEVSRTLLSILANLNNVNVVSAHLPISNSSSPFIKTLRIVMSTPITIGINIAFMFHSFFVLWQSQSTCLFFHFLWFSLSGPQDGKVHYSTGSLFFLTITRCDLLAGIRWSVCISKSYRILCISFSRTDSGLCIYDLFIWSNFNFFHNSWWITFMSCLVLYSFCAILLHLLIMWLIVSSLSLHNLHVQFYCILSIFVLT